MTTVVDRSLLATPRTIPLCARDDRRLNNVTHSPREQPDRDRRAARARTPKEECGVFGVWAPGEEVAKLTYYGLYALQHRGQEAAGIAVADGSQVLVFKDLGLVSQVFDEQTLAAMPGHVAVGHCRYSTTGSTTWENAQPVFRNTAAGTGVALGHNGNLVNTAELTARAAGPGLIGNRGASPPPPTPTSSARCWHTAPPTPPSSRPPSNFSRPCAARSA